MKGETDKYREALEVIAGASDQANAIHLKVVAQTALDWKNTLADHIIDEQNKAIKEQQEMIDKYRDMQSEIASYDKKLSEEAESTWRDTVLHPNYKSEYDEEE